jgi:hypothetical protein
MADEASDASLFAFGYVILRTPELLQSFEEGKTRALKALEKAQRLSAGQPEQLKEIQECRAAMMKIASEVNLATHKSNVPEIQMLFKDPTHPPPGLNNRLKSILKDPSQYQILGGPVFELFYAQQTAMAKEKAIGDNLAAQRVKLIGALNLTLLAAIILNSILSGLLAISLMRSLSRRVYHVMENTARIVKREDLDPAKKGADEIAYLDQVLYETGNRILELETFKQALVAVVSHELRTPLTAVYTTLELLTAGVYGELSEDGKRRLKIADEEAQNLIRLVNDLLHRKDGCRQVCAGQS